MQFHGSMHGEHYWEASGGWLGGRVNTMLLGQRSSTAPHDVVAQKAALGKYIF